MRRARALVPDASPGLDALVVGAHPSPTRKRGNAPCRTPNPPVAGIDVARPTRRSRIRVEFGRRTATSHSPCPQILGESGYGATPELAQRDFRGAFTLVELLAALGISLLLIAAVTASLDIYVRLTTTGEFSVERQQVTRALLEQMTLDVSSIVFTPPEPEEDSETDTAATQTETVVEVEDATNSISSASVGLIGDSQTLVLNVSRPSQRLGYSSPLTAVSLNERTSDLLSVSYFLATPGGAGLRGAVGDSAAGYFTTSSYLDGIGLARLEGDRMAIDYADLQTDTELLAGAAKLIAPEVVSLQFRYFDGAAWFDVWDSTAYGALPQAIEVTLGFRALMPEDDSIQSGSSAPVVEEYVRHVIHVPIAEPYSASSTY